MIIDKLKLAIKRNYSNPKIRNSPYKNKKEIKHSNPRTLSVELKPRTVKKTQKEINRSDSNGNKKNKKKSKLE